MQSKNTESNFEIMGQIDRQTHNIDSLKHQYNGWDDMSKLEKLNASRKVEPDETDTAYNVTTTNLHEYFVNNLDPNQNGVKDNLEISFIALGETSGSITENDNDLNNRLYEERITDVADNGTELLTSTFVDSTEANGEVLNEVGLYTGDPDQRSSDSVFLLNHANFADVTKDDSKTLTFDVTLSFSNPSA